MQIIVNGATPDRKLHLITMRAVNPRKLVKAIEIVCNPGYSTKRCVEEEMKATETKATVKKKWKLQKPIPMGALSCTMKLNNNSMTKLNQ